MREENNKDFYEYELIDIEWSINYDLSEDYLPIKVQDDSSIKDSPQEEPLLPLDSEGIALGDNTDAIRQRKNIITSFWRSLRSKFTDPDLFKVHNLALNEDIYLRAISLDEALSHSAVNYLSTKAFLRLENVLINARPVGRVETKADTVNQRGFEKLLIMTYEYEDIGRVKLTVGLRRRKTQEEVNQKIEYAITHLPDGVPLIPPKTKGKKKAPHKK